jgi:DNA-directed RNA polymerase subunit beta'
MATETIGRLLLKEYLPQDLHKNIDEGILDKKGLSNLFENLATKPSNVYSDAVSKLAQNGFEVATRNGSSLTLSDLQCPIDKKAALTDLQKEIKKIKDKKLPTLKEQSDIFDAFESFNKNIEKKIIEEGVKSNKTLAKIVVAGSRGSPAQYRSTVALAGIVNDAKGIPMVDQPIVHSFAEGLTLPEYMAHSYVSRAGEVNKKLSTADAGYYSKQLSRASMTLRVEEHDCGTENGVEFPVSDRHSIGCFLAKNVGSYNRNNEVTPSLLNALSNKNIYSIVVRSPITCQSSKHLHYGAICQLCAGKREKGLPEIGSFIGVISASALGEPTAQGSMNMRHNITASKASVTHGFKLIEQMANIPKTFQGKAPLAEADGLVTDIQPSPAGGHFVYVNGNEHYVPTGFDIYVKKGQKVEAGDALSEGIINPAEIVQYKGIGEGRKYFVEATKKAFDDSGMPINRRNFEVVAKAAIDHVKITDPNGLGNYLPDEIVSYSAIEKDYKPRPDNKTVRTDLALNKYLEEPVLHFTIGTRLTSKMLDQLNQNKIDHVVVHDDPPPFEPHMVRLLDVPEHVPDWMHQLYSTYVERRLINAVNEGSSSSLDGPSPIAGLSYGLGFGNRKK